MELENKFYPKAGLSFNYKNLILYSIDEYEYKKCDEGGRKAVQKTTSAEFDRALYVGDQHSDLCFSINWVTRFGVVEKDFFETTFGEWKA